MELNARIEEAYDALESMLILVMMHPPEVKRELYGNEQERGGGYLISTHDIGGFWDFPDHLPTHAYTADMADNDRLFTLSSDMLLKNPIEYISPSLECLLTEPDGTFRWAGISCLPRRPKKACSVGKADKWFAVHVAHGDQNGWRAYYKRVGALNKFGKPIPVSHEQQGEPPSSKQSKQIILCCSIFEDSCRPGSVLATASANSSLSFPVGLEAYKNFFSLRDGYSNTPTGRKNPIVHWCSEHLRHKERGEFSKVSGHWRGAESIEINGFKLKLEINE